MADSPGEPDTPTVQVAGRRLDPEHHRLRDFLTRTAQPHDWLETSQASVFAAGDVRHGSTKRVAGAVGEGAMAVALAHRRLAELGRH
jgi:thioredoxin reductase (NADPH)